MNLSLILFILMMWNIYKIKGEKMKVNEYQKGNPLNIELTKFKFKSKIDKDTLKSFE